MTPGREHYCALLAEQLAAMWPGHPPLHYALPAGRTAPYPRTIPTAATSWTGVLAGGLAALDWDGLFQVDATLIGSSDATGFGYTRASTRRFDQDAQGTTAETWTLGDDGLVVRRFENGSLAGEQTLDAAGHAIRTRDALGVEQRRDYDALGRLVAVGTPDGWQEVRFDGYGRPQITRRDGKVLVEYQ